MHLLSVIPVGLGLLTVGMTWQAFGFTLGSVSRASPLSAAQERALRPGQTFKECNACPEMVVVPAGSFMIGSPPDEEAHAPNEGPQHRVTFARPLAVGRFAVTFDEWDACVADGGCNGYKPAGSRGKRPIYDVSWNDAKAFVGWLSKKTGKAYRLPSESEREYVTRAATTTPFWWGSSISTDQANYKGDYTYGNGPKGENRKTTMPVDAFQPNPWGLYQVHGNVWEWVEDCWNAGYRGAPTDGSAWRRGDCSQRVQRGGSWNSIPSDLRAAFRNRVSQGFRDSDTGFRVIRTLLKP